VSENCAENFPLTPAGRGQRPLFMLLVGLSGDPLARSWSDSRQLLYTVRSREAKMEIPAEY
jgi:hypothetical protein